MLLVSGEKITAHRQDIQDTLEKFDQLTEKQKEDIDKRYIISGGVKGLLESANELFSKIEAIADNSGMFVGKSTGRATAEAIWKQDGNVRRIGLNPDFNLRQELDLGMTLPEIDKKIFAILQRRLPEINFNIPPKDQSAILCAMAEYDNPWGVLAAAKQIKERILNPNLEKERLERT